MADAPPPAHEPLTFVPKDCVSVTIGNVQVNVYPRVDPLWCIPEKGHAYHVTKSAFHAVHLQPDLHLDAFGQYMNSSAVVDSQRFEFEDRFKASWIDMRYLTILSFHNSQGQEIANAVTDADASVLKPVINGNIADCRPADVRFVRVQIALDFRDLCTAAAPNDNTTLRAAYYIELPQTMAVVLNGLGVARNLVTFHGAADLRTLSVEEIRRDILSLVFQDAPVELVEAAFNLATVSTDSSGIQARIKNDILRIAMSTIEHAVFESLCPNYTMEPQAAVESVFQITKDAEGNAITYTVAQYYAYLFAAARPLLNQRTLPVDLVGIFIKNSHPDIQNVLKETYPKLHDARSREKRFVCSELNVVLKKMIAAEHRISSTQDIINRAIGGQSFTAGTPALASVAERTLTKYQPGDGGRPESPSKRRRGVTCFGCGKPHPFTETDCPHFNDPAYQKKARENRAAFMDAKRSRGKGGRLRKGEPNFTDLSESGKEKMKQQILSAAANSSAPGCESSDVSSLTSPGSPKKKPPVVLIVGARVLATPNRQALPVPVQSLLPHIVIELGTDPDAPPVAMNCVVDTGASLTTGNFFYCSHIAKRFPQVVSAVYTSENFAPITLSGVVQTDGVAVTAELPVAFEFHMPYLTSDGSPTNLLVACGPQVSVNLILGIPFLSAAGMSIDLEDNVVDCKKLAVKPFSITSMKARVHVPSSASAHTVVSQDDTYGSFVSDLEKLEQKITELYSVVSYAPKRARFLESADAPSVVSDTDQKLPVTNRESNVTRSGVPTLSNEVLRDALAEVAALGLETPDYNGTE
eukprot:scaffold72230_cov36-Cyclotella_meneghiniana.AAC.3